MANRDRRVAGSVAAALACALLSGSAPLGARQMTADQVVAKCAEAMGGKDRIAAVKTLRITATYAGRNASVVQEIKRPNRLRTESGYVLVFDGVRGCFLKQPEMPKDAKPRPACAPFGDSMTFEADIAKSFPAFFEVAPAYQGTSTIGDAVVHKLSVTMPRGAIVTYFIDGTTFLPVKAIAAIKMSGKPFLGEYFFSDYQETSGLKFPHTVAYNIGSAPPVKATVTKIEVNVPIPDDRFVIPPDIK